MPYDVPDVPTDETGIEPRGQRSRVRPLPEPTRKRTLVEKGLAGGRLSQNTEMATLHVETFRSNIHPHWKLRWKYRWMRMRLGKNGRALADELGRRIEAAILFGEDCA